MKKLILVYSGFGVNATCLQQTLAMLRNQYDNDFDIVAIDHSYIKNTAWEENTVLLVMPGGQDLPYVRRLQGICNNRIKSFVKNGGSYLGICAGAYYASSKVEFAKDDPKLEVIGNRELGFFKGIASGPVYSGFNYNSNKGSISAAIINLISNNSLQVYFHGGCTFKDIPTDVTVIAQYADLEQPAIIGGAYGKGKFVLSGVHFEYDPELLDPEDQYLQNIIPKIQQTNQHRLQLMDHILEVNLN